MIRVAAPGSQPFLCLLLMDSVLLTVIIPVYNTAAALERCLDSFFLSPRFLQSVDFVVVDDGSDVPVCVDRPQVTVVRQSHAGAAAARNAGIAHADGRFVWFFDADDRVAPLHLDRLLELLQSLPDGALLFHTGPMQQGVDRVGEVPVTPSAPLSLSQLLLPRSGCLDHTTYLVARGLLLHHPELRYPEGRSLLEDSSFVLQLLDTVATVHTHEGLSPYIRTSDQPSLTSGAWNSARCQQFLPDIIDFFDRLSAFVGRHPDCRQLPQLFDRYCYLYLRVLAVKGCPWNLLSEFRSRLHQLGYRPASLKGRLLNGRCLLFLLSTSCRLLR